MPKSRSRRTRRSGAGALTGARAGSDLAGNTSVRSRAFMAESLGLSEIRPKWPDLSGWNGSGEAVRHDGSCATEAGLGPVAGVTAGAAITAAAAVAEAEIAFAADQAGRSRDDGRGGGKRLASEDGSKQGVHGGILWGEGRQWR